MGGERFRVEGKAAEKTGEPSELLLRTINEICRCRRLAVCMVWYHESCALVQPTSDAQRLARRGVRRRKVPFGVGHLLRRPRLARAARGERNNNGARALLHRACRTAGRGRPYALTPLIKYVDVRQQFIY